MFGHFTCNKLWIHFRITFTNMNCKVNLSLTLAQKKFSSHQFQRHLTLLQPASVYDVLCGMLKGFTCMRHQMLFPGVLSSMQKMSSSLHTVHLMRHVHKGCVQKAKIFSFCCFFLPWAQLHFFINTLKLEWNHNPPVTVVIVWWRNRELTSTL